MKRNAIMLCRMHGGSWRTIGSMDLPSAKGDVTRRLNRGGGSMNRAEIGFVCRTTGITVLSSKNNGKWTDTKAADEDGFLDSFSKSVRIGGYE